MIGMITAGYHQNIKDIDIVHENNEIGFQRHHFVQKYVERVHRMIPNRRSIVSWHPASIAVQVLADEIWKLVSLLNISDISRGIAKKN
jgi:hypothetical protein